MTRAVNQLAAGQKATSGLGPASRSPVVVNAGRGLGPMILPKIPGRIVTSTLMRDAIAAQAKFIRRSGDWIFSELSPAE